jgi:hypothetical protein
LKEWKNHIQSLIYKLEKAVEIWAGVNIFIFTTWKDKAVQAMTI